MFCKMPITNKHNSEKFSLLYVLQWSEIGKSNKVWLLKLPFFFSMWVIIKILQFQFLLGIADLKKKEI